MDTPAVRTTVELELVLHLALERKAADTQCTISDLVNDAIRAALREDEEDFAAIRERANEPNRSYEEFLAQLRADGTI